MPSRAATTSSALPYLAFAVCSIVWGTTFLFIRFGNDSLPPVWACTLRLVLAAAILNAMVFASGNRWPKGIALRTAFWYGVWEFGFNMPLLYLGERTVPSGIAAVLYATSPVLGMFQARAMGMERLDGRRLAAALFALLGVAIIFWREIIQGGSPLGLLLVFLAAATGIFAGLVLQRGPKQSAIAVNAVGALVAVPMCLLVSIALGERRPIPTSTSQIFPIVYLATMGSVVAFGTFAWLINHWKVTTVAFIGVIVPMIAVTLGFFVRGEPFPPTSLLGAAVIVVSVAFALRYEAKQHKRADEVESMPAA